MQSTIAKTKEDMLCGSLNIDTSVLMAAPVTIPSSAASPGVELFPGSYVTQLCLLTNCEQTQAEAHTNSDSVTET